MTVRIELSENVEQALRAHGSDLDRAAKEAILVELYREQRLFHSEFANALGISRYEADGVLKRHGVCLDLSAEELEDDLDGLRSLVQK